MQKQVLSKEHKKIKRKAVFQENLPSYIMLAPFFVFFFIFLVLPILSSIVLSFTTYDMINKPSFAGLGNYIRMFFDDDVFPWFSKTPCCSPSYADLPDFYFPSCLHGS